MLDIQGVTLNILIGQIPILLQILVASNLDIMCCAAKSITMTVLFTP
jgi:hypothetical protein